MYRYTLCEIDLEAIRNNVRVMRAHIAGGAKFLAVVKADAYGHGAVPVARAAREAGADMLAVAIPEEGQVLRYGGYALACIQTPGHTPGHICLYDRAKKLMFTGDTVLFDITPNITYMEGYDTLSDYLDSLKKLERYPVELALPAHKTTGYEAAAHMTWSIKASGWDAFPDSQQWFATGETLAHLLYLHTHGRLNNRLDADGMSLYSCK